MFGKGGGPLSIWIKELCELVFIQTLQAFIYALVISFIATIIQGDYASSLTSDDHNAAVAIICVVALTAIFKVEDIARKIFGFGPTKADRQNAIASLAKTGFALKLGKNVLDNGAKLVGGMGAVAGSHAKRVKARQDRNKDLEALNKDAGMLGPNSSGSSGGVTKTQDVEALRKRKQMLQDEANKKLNAASEKRRMAKVVAGENMVKYNNEALQLEKEARKHQSDSDAIVIPQETTTFSSGGGNSNSSNGIKDYEQRKRAIEKEFASKESQYKKERREGFKNIARGLTESGAALVGSVAGGIIGGADGDLDGAARGMVAGAGVGDWVGKTSVDLTSGVMEFGEARAKAAAGLVKEYKQNVEKAIEEQQKELDRQMDSAMHDINSQIERQSSDLKRSINAMGKGLKMTTANHSIKKLDSTYRAKQQIESKPTNPNVPTVDRM